MDEKKVGLSALFATSTPLGSHLCRDATRKLADARDERKGTKESDISPPLEIGGRD